MPKALVIIDIQRDYFPGGKMPLHKPEAAAEKAGRVLATFREAGLPVIHVQQQTPVGGPFLVEGTEGAEIMPQVEPVSGEPIVQKRAPNAFLGTDLEQRLRDGGVDEVVVVGMMTSMCVDATTRAGADLGFKMTVVPDACAAPSLNYDDRTVAAEDVHTAFIAALHPLYATLTPTDEMAAAAGLTS